MPSSGVEYLASLFAVMDRQCLVYPMLQGVVAGAVGFAVGSRIEGSGWLVGGDGNPLGGELAMGLSTFLAFGWWLAMIMVLPVWRQAFFMQFIPQLHSTDLLYLVLEHHSHEKIAPFLARDPMFPWVTRIRTHEPFSLRIRSFIMAQPAICRVLGLDDYPANWGKLLLWATLSGGVFIVLGFFIHSQFLQAVLWFAAWFLLAGALAFRQARIQALSYTIASFFVRWLDAY